MKRTIITLLSLLLIITTSFSQKDSKAKEVLDKSSDLFTSGEGMSAYFTLNIKDVKAKKTQSFDGNMLMKGEKFFLSIPDADTWFDGKTQWSYLKDSEEVNITEPKSKDLQMMNLAVIFTVYKTNSDYKYIGEKVDIKGRPVYEIELIPKNKKEEISKIIVQISKSDNFPVMFRIIYRKDLENIIFVNKYQLKQTYPDNTFVFDKKKYPKAEIIDLR